MDNFHLILNGPRCIPALWQIDNNNDDYHSAEDARKPSSSRGTAIEGEVYDISDKALEAMDILEGVAIGHYYRVKTSIEIIPLPTNINKEQSSSEKKQTSRMERYFPTSSEP